MCSVSNSWIFVEIFCGQPEKVQHTKSRIYARDYSKNFYFNLFQVFDYTVYRMVYSSDLSLLGGVPAQLSQHEVEAIAAMWVAICCSLIFFCWPLEQPIPFVLLSCPVQISTAFCGVQTDGISNQPQACLDEHDLGDCSRFQLAVRCQILLHHGSGGTFFCF